MSRKLFRIIISLIWIVVGILNLIMGNMDWWYTALAFLIAGLFLSAAFRQNKED